MHTFRSLLLTLATGAAAALAGPVAVLDPSNGAISGNPGDTAGWGFTLTNDSSGYLIPTSSAFLETTPVGVYMDFISTTFLVLAPEQSWSQSFDASVGTGFGAYLISPAALAGALSMGQLQLVYDVYSGDPTSDPDAVQIEFSSTVKLPASVAVTGTPPQTVVPEPSTAVLVWLALAGVAAARLSSYRDGAHGRRSR